MENIDFQEDAMETIQFPENAKEKIFYAEPLHAFDEEGFTRAVILALNNSTNRGTTGAGDLRTSAQIL